MNVSINSLSGTSWANQTQMAGQADKRLERLFSKFDTDGDGTISKDELATAKANSKEGSRDAQLLESLTTDDSGGVSLEDFKTQVKAQMEQMRSKGQAGGPPSGPPDASEMFSKVDSNGDGSLDKSELEEMAAGGPQGGASSSKMLDEMDTNQDGVVSEAEFKAHMEKMQSQMMSKVGGQSSGGEQNADGAVSTSYTSEQLAQLLAEALKSYQQNDSGAWSLVTDSGGSDSSSSGVYV